MLKLENITKDYKVGDMTVHALRGVSLEFRRSEFVAVLGHSGCGKTTLLNIIGGLDRYTSGDVAINGRSTKNYKDRDWDSYRNHSVGFVFQSYNLIPHQSVLRNVELALTIAGVSKEERTRRAKKALSDVGLADQLKKRPNQLSGGQMQRVAIARALVNDPEILLADEPTGALDSETSVQVMEILKKVAEKRLVVMVTHNPELAEKYATRIVRLKDGLVTDDSDPCSPETEERDKVKSGRARMGFLTSLSLSLNNLMTKKGRTVLTAFAGSIGIIGIALILSMSNGVNKYIDDIQRETMTSYPITIQSEAVDLSGLMGMRSEMMRAYSERGENADRTGINAGYSKLEAGEALSSSVKENNLTAFKRYLDDPESEINGYIGENGVVYSYDVDFNVYAYDPDGKLIDTDSSVDDLSGGSKSGFSGFFAMSSMMGRSSVGAKNFTELMPGADGLAVSRVVTDNYELLYGNWPEKLDEVVLILEEDNSLDAETLYQLGFITGDEYLEAKSAIESGEKAQERSWDYSEIDGRRFYLVTASDFYEEGADGLFINVGDNPIKTQELAENGLELKISGVVREKDGLRMGASGAAVGYTSLLTDWVVEHTDNSAVVKAQEADSSVNVLNGLRFEALDDEAKIADAKEHISKLSIGEKANLYTLIAYYERQNAAGEEAPAETQLPEGYPEGGEYSQPAPSGEEGMAAMLDAWLAGDPDPDILLGIYDEQIGGQSYEDNLKSFGKVSYEAPDSISIYADSFEAKELISDAISRYNEGEAEENRITYTDYVALLTSSITEIVDVVSYVLIAFVAVSLVVSSIMIGIITHISVMERTKEIGILRALGASKRNISQVFNAETVIIGLISGALGVGVSMVLTIPINAILRSLTGSQTVAASLPISNGAILVAISVAITVIGGLIPAKRAAKKDPVIALRTE